ncbi:PREDICTED: ATP synthase mitochondrial F1 complex assembly factor 1 [Polistes canadensis]|uniref:ATP synthase mitochondrial F1 complex assembly factor 1 n=1 Tax=Polistes canadensis TaxID=91411 RepID=UPI000718F746|nr:PREDICTED: ATP synthase mitochondrial F1 complex assembly factor 1 [Polistes canadensis]
MSLWFSSIFRYSRFITANKVALSFTFMASRTKTDRVLENLKSNPYFDKYAKKIAKLQMINPELLEERIGEQEKKIQKKKETQEQERNLYQAKAKTEVLQPSPIKEACLSDIMNIEMIKGKTKEEIGEIWMEYHKQKDYICAIIESEQYEKILGYGSKYPLFLLPLPRKQGYEFFLSQFQGNKVYMTSLLWYQTHKENAPECLTLTHYTEFKDSMGIVLMRGEFDLNFLNCQEAQCLTNELQLYYIGKNSQRLELLETFNNNPNNFKYNDLINQLEKISF